MTVKDIPAVDKLLKKEFKAHNSPIIELIQAQTHDPFCVLVGTILSARTKDQCTTGAVKRLFASAHRKGTADDASIPAFTPEDLERLSVEQIEKLIYPVGFYHDKARHLKELPKVLKEKFGGVLPNTVEELCELPGVGRKTANVIQAVVFQKARMAVDTHVFRVSHRIGLVPPSCTTPLSVEKQLTAHFPDSIIPLAHHWLILHGRYVCTARNPRCVQCGLLGVCLQKL